MAYKKAHGDFIRTIAFRHGAFVHFIGYIDGTYEVFVSGSKSTGTGVPFVPFKTKGFDYYRFVITMGHKACSWKEAKYLAHRMPEIAKQVDTLAWELRFVV